MLDSRLFLAFNIYTYDIIANSQLYWYQNATQMYNSSPNERTSEEMDDEQITDAGWNEIGIAHINFFQLK